MALKDWRIYAKGKKGVGYKKENQKVDVIYSSKKSGDYTTLNLVNIYEGGRLEFEKEFKSKAQAMTHAKSYMRKH